MSFPSWWDRGPAPQQAVSGGQRASPVAAVSWLSSAQKDLYAKVASLRVESFVVCLGMETSTVLSTSSVYDGNVLYLCFTPVAMRPPCQWSPWNMASATEGLNFTFELT